MFLNLMLRLRMLLTDVKEESGQALVEYGLIIALIAVVCVGLVVTLGTQIAAAFDTITKALP